MTVSPAPHRTRFRRVLWRSRAPSARWPVSPADGLEPDALAGLLARSQRVVAQAQSLLFKVTTAADRAKTARSQGSASTADLLSTGLGGDRAESARNVRTANAIHKTLTQSAMDQGKVTIAQAEIIVRTLVGLPTTITQTQRLGCEEALIEAAQKLTLKDLRRRADRIGDLFAPDKTTADTHEQDTLRDRERAARGKTQFWMIDQKDGTHKGGFTIPDLHADMLKTLLDAIAAPRRDHLRQDQIDDFGDLTWPRRQGLAFLELLEHTPTDHLPAGSTTLTVNLDHQQLADGIGAATLSTGTRITVDQVRRMACETGLIPMVFDGESLPLDLGRAKRLFTRHQRIAIANRDGGGGTSLHEVLGGVFSWLRQAPELVRNPPRQESLGPWRQHRPPRRCPALQLPPPRGPRRRLGHPIRPRRPPRIHPTQNR